MTFEQKKRLDYLIRKWLIRVEGIQEVIEAEDIQEAVKYFESHYPDNEDSIASIEPYTN